MNVCSYSNVNPLDVKGLNERFRLLFKEVCYLKANSGGGGGFTALTGDVLASGTGSVAATLATVNSNIGTFNTLTVNGKGLVTSASNTSYVTSVAALTLGTFGTDATSTVANGTTTPVITLNLPSSSAANRGLLTSADWTTFNNKVSSQWTTSSGDIYYTAGTVGIGTSSNTLNTLSVVDTTLAGSAALAGSLIDLQQTFNTTGSPTVFKLNLTNTASGANARVFDLKIGGTSNFYVDKLGNTISLNGNYIGLLAYSVGMVPATSGVFSPIGKGIRFFNGLTTEAETAFVFRSSQAGSRTSTSGTSELILLNEGFAPTSGTGVWNSLTIKPTINQIGGANGITRGLYLNATVTAAADYRAIEVATGKIVYSNTVTAAGTTGAQTINKISGTVNIAAAGTSVVVTNSLVTTNSLVSAFVITNDTNKTSVYAVVPAAGSFTIYVNPAPAAEISVGFKTIN